MFEYRTQGFNGYAVKYSPFFDSRIAVASSQHYGLVGNGRLYILGLTPKQVVAEKWYVHNPVCSLQSTKAYMCTRTDEALKGLTLRTPYMISPGPRPMRTSS